MSQTYATLGAMEGLPEHEMRRLRALRDEPIDLEDLVNRRLGGEPLQYIEGSAPFASLELLVDERVLVPRPETEYLYEIAARLVRLPKVVVDLCTGSGALALALKKHFPGAAVFATDISPEAIQVAMVNAKRTGLQVYFGEGDLFDPLPPTIKGEVDLIVANPPYVAESEYAGLPADVKREPKLAVVSGPSGLEVIQDIGAKAREWLRPGGVVVCEIGETQATAAQSSFDLPVVIRQDLTNRDRYVVGARP